MVVQYQAGYVLTDPTLVDLVDGVIRYVNGRYFAQMREPATTGRARTMARGRSAGEASRQGSAA